MSRDAPPSLHHSITPYETHQLHRIYFCRCNVSRLYTHFITPYETHQLHRIYFCRCNVSRLYTHSITSSLHHSKHVTSLQTFLSFSASQILRFYKPFQRTAPPKALQLSTKKRAKLQKILIQMLIFFKKLHVGFIV